MFFPSRTTPCFVMLSLVLGATCSVGVAQTAIDDVHIAPRAHGIPLANPGLASNAARLPVGSLIRASVDLVMVPVTITDARNRPVLGLDQANFQLFENKKPQEIKHFWTDDTPVSIGLIIDTSGSMAEKLDRAREAVDQFCEAANPQDEFFLITFADEPHLATDFTTRTEEIENGLLTARSKGRTALLDAIYLGIQKMRSARYSRKALLILSDGGDNHSRYTERDVKGAIKEADIMIYAVGTYDRYFNTEEERMGPELLASITDQTGGHSFTLSRLSDLPIVTHIIGAQLRHQYVLAYQPRQRPRDGKWHKINVKLLLPKKLQSYFLRVQARAGYYAHADPLDSTR